MPTADTLNSRWMNKINAARKREDDYRKTGVEILRIYNGEMVDQIPFNILFSNTETLLPAVYNSTPRPVVQRRFKDDDPIGKVAAQASQRLAEFVLDMNDEKYPSFDAVAVDAILDGLLPGRGVTIVKYDADILDGDKKENTIPVVRSEYVCFEAVPWDRVVFGYAKTWTKVPFMAVYYEVDKEEAVKLFGSRASKMVFSPRKPQKDEDQTDRPRDGDSKDSETEVCPVWKVWDKNTRKILFVSPEYEGTGAEEVLKTEDDPLKLEGFFPVPEPLRFIRKAHNLLPTALYTLYQNQAKELNRITVRLNKIINMTKVRGIYNSQLQDIENLLTKDDGIMLPATNAAALDNGNLNTAIWMVPVEKMIPIINELLAARAQCKQTIYEITGISDILRGQTNAQETLGAQKIKENWATLRLKRVQREVQRYCRDLIRLVIEIAAHQFDEETWAKCTGMYFPDAQAKQQAQMAMQLAERAQQPPPPEAVQILEQPTWEDILSALRDDTTRNYRIDIETNSTVDVEATEDQKNIAEVLQAVSQFLTGVAPLIESGTMPFEAAQGMLLGIVRRYRFGPEIEDQIKAMKPPQPKQDPKDQIALQTAQMEAEARREEIEMERVSKKEEHQLKLAEMKAKGELAQLMARIKIHEAQQKLELSKQQAVVDVAKARAMPQKPKGKQDATP